MGLLAAVVRGVCLIRPGATTHAFDQNQRRVPLTFLKAGSPNRLLVSAPPDPASAPPGNYLLFVMGSAERTDVPSLARWIKMGPTGVDDSDAVRPAPNSDFSSVCDPNTPNGWIVSWTETADDSGLSTSGTVIADTVRKSSDHINDGNWSGATLAYGHAGVTPGSLVSYSTAVGATTYLRMRSVDNGNRLAALSRELVLVPWTTLNYDCPGGSGMYAGGGGGSGASLQRAPGATSVGPSRERSSSIASGSFENSVLDGTGIGSIGRDLLRLPAGIAGGGIGAVRVRELTGHAAGLDAARLLVVDHDREVAAYALDGVIVAGTRQSAGHIGAADGSDLTTVLNGSGSFAILPDDPLTVVLGGGGGASPLVVTAGGSGPLKLQVPDGQGGWRTASEIVPRVDPDDLVFDAPGADTVRIVTRGYASVSDIERLTLTATSPTPQVATLLSARSARLGDVKAAAMAIDSVLALLAGPDTLELTFGLPPAATGVRDYFLVVDATPQDPQASTAAGLRPSGEEPLLRFALEQNRPNPFAGRTTIRFALPSASPVRLEVFDAAGRRVRTLALGQFAPGYHTLEWDHRDAAGTLVQPGVYLYRLVAGANRDQKKMVLLP